MKTVSAARRIQRCLVAHGPCIAPSATQSIPGHARLHITEPLTAQPRSTQTHVQIVGYERPLNHVAPAVSTWQGCFASEARVWVSRHTGPAILIYPSPAEHRTISSTCALRRVEQSFSLLPATTERDMANQEYYGQSHGQGYGYSHEGANQQPYGSAEYNQGYPPQAQGYVQQQYDQYGQGNRSPYPPAQVRKLAQSPRKWSHTRSAAEHLIEPLPSSQ